MDSKELVELFFKDLKEYNPTNFHTLLTTDMDVVDNKLYKSCSSIVTRYFIFCEKHPDISESDLKILYYKLGIDMIAKFFSEFPASDIQDLNNFQQVLREYKITNNTVLEGVAS